MIKQNIITKTMTAYDIYLDHTNDNTYLVSIIYDGIKSKEFMTLTEATTFFNAVEYHGLKNEILK